ncbi:HAD-IB family hydrolase [Spongiibacter taiwanensis]|uniref:histidinol-phosphatase n=1 Tax=Spongiibacter taiwanensis TaxID=1748242 RepID=UPI002034D0C6|nr:HAD family hydrolase [Spongiibacter taiwanensis]USA42104.1 HAD-IB family hydrolase [Spongiibacter taiwanensis]
MALAIFDLDNTLLGGDSDHAWGEFLVEQGLVNPDYHRRQNDEFYRQYCEGGLDIDAYLGFALAPLAGKTVQELIPLHAAFMASHIQPMMLPKAAALVEQHRQAGDTLMIITATNDFVTGPIARALGIAVLLGSQAEVVDGRYTGKPTGLPCFQHGKVTRLEQWMAANNATLNGSYFYSDSHNDLPLLSEVDHPVAVDPDERLAAVASEKGWPIISLRD